MAKVSSVDGLLLCKIAGCQERMERRLGGLCYAHWGIQYEKEEKLRANWWKRSGKRAKNSLTDSEEAYEPSVQT